MRILRKFLALTGALILIVAAWLWWNRPQKVDMTAYVPADSLLYLEANDLPAIASSLTQTDAWKALAAPAGIRTTVGQVGLWGKFAAWTGIGPAESVVLSRAQVAVTVLGMDAADAGDTLKIKPRYAIIVETHTNESRARAVAEKRVGDFARRAYGQPLVEQKKIDGTELTIWSAPTGERRIVAAVTGSVIVVGTNEVAVQACLAVRRGERPSLTGNPQVEEIRKRVNGKDALSFGYVSPTGSAQLLEVATAAYAGQMIENPQLQGAIASRLPQLASKLLGQGGWSARLARGMIEDHYYLSLQNGTALRLKDALASQPGGEFAATRLLPAEAYSLTRYNYRNPEVAWRSLSATISSQVDAVSAVFVTRLLGSVLSPYGIDDPETFLRAVGSEIVTARLDDTGTLTVTIVEVRDEKTLRDFVNQRLGPKARTERVGENELLISVAKEKGAASFVAGRLLMGSEASVRRCLEAQSQGRTLPESDSFKKAASLISQQETAGVTTLTDDSTPARTFIVSLASQRGVQAQPFNQTQLAQALDGLAYAVSETRLVEGGFERKTQSSFGQFGSLASQFSTK
jgi:hypothetical protein